MTDETDWAEWDMCAAVRGIAFVRSIIAAGGITGFVLEEMTGSVLEG